MIQLGDVEELKQQHEERTAQLRHEVQANALLRGRASLLTQLRLWVGDQLIREGKWLKAQGTDFVDPGTGTSRPGG